MRIATLAFGVLSLSSNFASVVAQNTLPARVDARPALTVDPRPPGPDRGGQVLTPLSKAIERDAWVADRFLAEGQRAVYPFTCQEGELALFELVTYGYERGWQSSAEIVVRSSDSGELLRERVDGGTVYRALFAFVAPAEGAYELELMASRQYFRYSLTRHAQFQRHLPGARYSIGPVSEVYDCLSFAENSLAYRIEVVAGEELELALRPVSDALVRQAQSQARVELLGRSASGQSMRRMDGKGQDMSAARNMAGDGSQAVEFEPVLSLQLEQALAGQAGTYARFLADGPTQLDFEVRAPGKHAGGLFRLEIQRNRERVGVHGWIADHEGEGLAGCSVEFYLEPFLDPVASVVSAGDGSYQTRVPRGDYTVLVRGAQAAEVTVLQAKVDESLELNAVAGRLP